ncbi:hypothetical protein BDQ12DRAFT_693086 [Crucibulum laeve]|uniref:Uncharacterized protein n=1 Tax=Crucibulum laeve TaxID=68775 RepID=A0A5C3LIQ6_9AGAR|nr:hypothetical protein BDQ12DRAFT_693086 [Crucibulum laeve]
MTPSSPSLLPGTPLASNKPFHPESPYRQCVVFFTYKRLPNSQSPTRLPRPRRAHCRLWRDLTSSSILSPLQTISCLPTHSTTLKNCSSFQDAVPDFTQLFLIELNHSNGSAMSQTGAYSSTLPEASSSRGGWSFHRPERVLDSLNDLYMPAHCLEYLHRFLAISQRASRVFGHLSVSVSCSRPFMVVGHGLELG